MTFDTQTLAISTGAGHAPVVAMRLNCSLLSGDSYVAENGVAPCSGNSSTSLERIAVGKLASAVVIMSDMTKQMADELPEAGYAFREWRREEVS